MDAQEFREFGRAAVDFIADYLENIRERWVSLYCFSFLILSISMFHIIIIAQCINYSFV